ncbi:hypothetical protein E2562_035223 [Oryza meyeriana var. granulata]|uniref:Uncharacterized protein n=1 Tax=Oryza meyeriana var. granulata TaxID=110450 RepID=A0A6G1DS32_9ORYZ|nr:hypothetical protein E2562_035223 [Oryza meyeriana var. granulata]
MQFVNNGDAWRTRRRVLGGGWMRLGSWGRWIQPWWHDHSIDKRGKHLFYISDPNLIPSSIGRGCRTASATTTIEHDR